MKNKNQFLKRVFIVSSLLVVAALLLTGCNGSFSFQGSAKPNEEGGVDITGGAQPNTAAQPETAVQPAGGTGLDQTTIILIGVGVAFFILILVMLVTRRQSNNEPRS
jgi:Na+-transporting methylmalonyl-CoA/oxaloacetate decarboxylase gamma subunit